MVRVQFEGSIEGFDRGRKAVQDSSIDIKWRKTGDQAQVAISEAAGKVLEALPKL